jgi:hypothetical protein
MLNVAVGVAFSALTSRVLVAAEKAPPYDFFRDAHD